jgi:hypothetical protein
MLDRIPAADLDRAAPESMQRIAATVGDLFLLAADHELMHSGQFSTVRRTLGKAVVF